MTDTRSRTSVIPKAAWVLAVVSYVVFFVVIRVGLFVHDPHASQWPEAAKLVLSCLLPLFPFGYFLLIGYIYGDAKRRLMRAWLWVLLAIFIPNAIGIILYFFLRDPLPFFCSNCGAPAKSTFTFCPNCSTPLRPTCTQCGRGMERGWAHCPSCGAAAPSGKQPAAPSGSLPAVDTTQT